MALDNIQAVNETKRVKSDEKVSANSIKYKPDSLERSKEKAKLIAKRDLAVEIVSEAIKDDVERGRNEKRILDKHFNYAAKIVALEDQINILDKPEGTLEVKQLPGNRAIRLIKNMIEAAKANSEFIYSEGDKKEEPKTEVVVSTPVVAPTEPITTPAVPVQQVVQIPTVETVPVVPVVTETPAIDVAPTEPVTTPVVPVQQEVQVPIVNVEQISEDNKDKVNESVENAINEESLKDDDIKDVIDDALGELKTEPATIDTVIIPEEIERKANEKIENFIKENENVEETTESVEEYEYVPMTEEEVVESQEKIAETPEISEIEKYHELIEKALKEEQEVAEINEAKGFDIAPVENGEPKIVEEEPIRDDVIVAPEREEKVEPRVIVATEEEKENFEAHKEESIEELAKLIKAEEETIREKEKQREDSEAKLKQAKEENEKLHENESNTEQRLAELKAERENKEKELQELKVKLNKKFENLINKTSVLESETIKNQEEISRIKEDTDKRNERVESLSHEANGELETIYQINEMLEKYGLTEENTEDEKTK